ncbi:MAG: CopG family ribbon-helix-helix protein [Omnitrophica WOR_2 bacterium]
MRTTIRIDDELLKKAKQLAARSGKSLTAIIEDALRESLARQELSNPREPVRLVTFKGKGLLPGVDLDDSAALLDVMES